VNMQNVSHIVPTSFNELVEEISDLTGLPVEVVQKKVWLEALQPGYNVTEEARNFGIDFHIYNEKMENFYKETYGFIFESTVEFCRPGKQKVLQTIKERIEKYIENNKDERINILMFGDGVGSDTIYLYSFYRDYANFFYFDIPGSKTFDFAIKRFHRYKVNVELITDYESIPKSFFDVIVALEVLEHLPNPEKAIEDISKFLKNGGIAIITESFGAVAPNFPTHLISNLKYDGKTPFIFLKHKMVLTYYSKEPLFRPFVFTKKEKIEALEKYKVYFSKDILKAFLKARLREWIKKIIK